MQRVKEKLSHIVGHNTWVLCNILEIFLSPQVKRYLISSIKIIVYGLPRELPNILKSDSHLPKKFDFCFNESHLKRQKMFLFYLKSSFRSQDIKIVDVTFCSYRTKIRLISKVMLSQPA